jgi:pyruvate-formate lyase-activating enzyme
LYTNGQLPCQICLGSPGLGRTKGLSDAFEPQLPCDYDFGSSVGSKLKNAVAIVHNNPEQSSIVFVDWTLGNVCNYACSYCPDRLHDGSLRWPAVDKVIGLSEKIVDHYRKLGRRAYIKFSGGEPSAYKGMLEVLARLRDLGALTALNTNGSREMAWWDSAIPLLDAIVLTYHIEFAELEHFAAVLKRLTEASITTHVNVTMVPERFDECVAKASELAARCRGMSIALKALRVSFGSELYPYTEQQKTTMARFGAAGAKKKLVRGQMLCTYDDGSSELLSPQELILRGANQWTSWNCNAGIESLALHFDGQVYRSVCGEGGAIGNLFDQSIAFPSAPIRCTKKDCHCLSDIRITKWRESSLDG